MRFSTALSHFENGALIARVRWNKDVKEDDLKGLSFVYMEHDDNKYKIPEALIDSGRYSENDSVVVLKHPMKKNRADLHSIWLPTVEDMCAQDWYVVDLRQNDWNAICGTPRRNR